MKKKTFLFFVLMLVIASLSEAAELKNYSKSSPDFSLRYPSEWKFTEESNPLKLRWEISAADSEDKLVRVILITEDLSKRPSDPTLDDYAKVQIEKAWDRLEDLNMRDEQRIFLRTRQVQENIFSGNLDSDSVRIRSFVFIVNRVGYVLVYVARQGSYGDHMEEFMSLAKSIRFGNESRFD